VEISCLSARISESVCQAYGRSLLRISSVVVFGFASKIATMTPGIPSRRHAKTPPPGETGQEALYLRSLSERQVAVSIKLRGGEVVRGWIEYFDDGMLRLTREGKPNLFIYKHQIETITESGKRREPRAGKETSAEGATVS
jgi:host factor-I protein